MKYSIEFTKRELEILKDLFYHEVSFIDSNVGLNENDKKLIHNIYNNIVFTLEGGK